MDKLLEQILKFSPPEIVPAVLGLIVIFFGTYYFKGLRSYTDTLNDPLFLTLAIISVGGFLIWQIQKPASPHLAANVRPLLLVPRFENDVGRELETLFVTQLRASVEQHVKDASIEQINSYVRDVETARLNAGEIKPFAVLFEPKVIREGVKTPVFCFRLLLLETGQVTTFAAVPAEPEKMNLGELSTALITISPPIKSSSSDPILTRLDALERKVAELSNLVLKLGTPSASPIKATDRTKTAKRAVVIGLDFDEKNQFPRLRFAVSDAQAITAVLQRFGFEVTLLANERATHDRIVEAIEKAVSTSTENDTLLVYYSGASVRSSDVGAFNSEQLILPTFDTRLNAPFENLTLNGVVDKLRPAASLNRLILIDGCHGTYGLPHVPLGGPSAPSEHAFQIISASQDDQFAFEMPQAGGGVFTQKIVGLLNASADSKADVSTRAMVTAITPELSRLSDGRQQPKLVTLAGSQDVMFDSAVH
jgi:hypothetical protein